MYSKAELEDVIKHQEKLTEEQQNAVFTDQKSFILSACPGSGKTKTALYRVFWRLAHWESSTSGLALLSFANVSIDEFKKGTKYFKMDEQLPFPHFLGTLDSFIHSFIVLPFGHLVMNCQRQPRLFLKDRKDVFNGFNVKARQGTRPVYDIDARLINNQLQFVISNRNIEVEGIKADDVLKKKQSFAKTGMFTHGDANFWAFQLLEAYPRIANTIARRFSEIVIDECQDTSGYQQAILWKLKECGSEIIFIGDKDQCIYSFQGARPEFMDELERKGCKVMPLSKNYRSNKLIVTTSKGFGSSKSMISETEPSGDRHGAFVTAYEEGSIGLLPQSFEKLLKSLELCHKKSAVIARANDQVQHISSCTGLSNLKGKTKLLVEAAILRDVKQDYQSAKQRIVQVLKGFSPGHSVWEAYEAGLSNGDGKIIDLACWRFIRSKQLPCTQLVDTEWHAQTKSAIEALLKECQLPLPSNINKAITAQGLNASRPLIEQFSSPNSTIRVTTIHGVKGETLEGVLLVANKAQVPKWLTQRQADQLPDEDERLAYVAMTRPKHLLVVALPKDKHDSTLGQWTQRGFQSLTFS